MCCSHAEEVCGGIAKLNEYCVQHYINWLWLWCEVDKKSKVGDDLFKLWVHFFSCGGCQLMWATQSLIRSSRDFGSISSSCRGDKIELRDGYVNRSLEQHATEGNQLVDGVSEAAHLHHLSKLHSRIQVHIMVASWCGSSHLGGRRGKKSKGRADPIILHFNIGIGTQILAGKMLAPVIDSSFTSRSFYSTPASHYAASAVVAS